MIRGRPTGILRFNRLMPADSRQRSGSAIQDERIHDLPIARDKIVSSRSLLGHLDSDLAWFLRTADVVHPQRRPAKGPNAPLPCAQHSD